METREHREGLENRPRASIRLEFFRHDDKAKPAEGQPDTTVRLSEKGRKHATEAGKAKSPKPEVAVAYGSPRERSSETAMRQMLADAEAIGDNTTLEEIRELVGQQQKVGKKDVVSSRLNFNWDGTPEFHDIAYDHYTKSKDALKFLYEDSDKLAKELKDEVSTTFTRYAGNIAELIAHYLKILPTWQRVVKQNPDKYSENELQRFLGSHHTVTESFLMKVIDKLEGPQGVKEFIDSLPDKNGFGFSEGYEVDLVGDDAGTDVILKYKDRTWTLTPELIAGIIADRDKFDKEVAGK